MRIGASAAVCCALAPAALAHGGEALAGHNDGRSYETGESYWVGVSGLEISEASVLTLEGHVLSGTVVNGQAVAGAVVNDFVGTERFYAAGLTGSAATVAVVEGGIASSSHVTTSRRSEIVAGPNAVVFETQHPTQTSFIAAGQDSSDPLGALTSGIAFDAELWSGALATAPPDPIEGTFQTSAADFFDVYTRVALTGINPAGETADVVTQSFGISTTTGGGLFTDVIADAVAEASGAVFVASAGNDGGVAPGSFGAPAVGFNGISVGATGQGVSDPFFAERSGFSSFGPTGFLNLATGVVTPGVYAAVDLVAPGQDLFAPFVDAGSGPGDFTLTQGTSFSAPAVAGGAGLLIDVARQTGLAGDAEIATDGRVIKAVLMNSADKLAGFDNGQALVDGAVVTAQALDFEVGAGQLNLDRALDQYTAGTTDVAGLGGGVVSSVGWDLGAVADGGAVFYDVAEVLAAGSTFTATLTWFAEFDLDAAAGTIGVDRFADLDLFVLERDAEGGLTTLAASVSPFSETEHLSFELERDSLITLAVSGFGEVWDVGLDGLATEYALAWSGVAVPGPASAAALGLVGLAAWRRRR